MRKNGLAQEVRSRLHPDTVSVKAGVVTIRRGFFYTGGVTAGAYADKVRAAFPNATILDAGEVWKPFRGGAKVAQQSHWFVKFTLVAEEVQR